MSLDLDFVPMGAPDFQRIINVACERGDRAESVRLELKGPLDLSTRENRAKIAKYVLAMANRDPRDARRHFRGWGVMLIGVEDGQAVGMENVPEEHEIRNGVMPALGDPFPQWNLVRHRVSATHECVLVLVAPPEAGDPIYVCHQRFPQAGLRDGGIYVRSADESREATAAEIKALVARAGTAAGAEADLLVEFSDPVVCVTETERAVEVFINRKLAELREREARPAPPAHLTPMLRLGLGLEREDEQLSPAEREERSVAWIRRRWPKCLPMLIATMGPHVYPTLTNQADSHLENVELEITVPGVRAHEGLELNTVQDWEVIPNYAEPNGLFDPPRMHRFSFPGRGDCPLDWDNTEAACTIRLTPERLPMHTPRRPHVPLVLEVLDPQATAVTGTWRLVASNLDTVETGTVEIPVQTRSVFDLYAALLSQRKENEASSH